MANYYTDVPELKYHLNNPMMERICELKERNYRDKDAYDYAPQDYADAMDSFDKVLEITGEITGEIIAPNAEGVDEEGPHCANGRVEYASGTKQNLDAMVKAGLNGMTMPRRFGGLNFPITPYTMCAEIVAAADAGFGNIIDIPTGGTGRLCARLWAVGVSGAGRNYSKVRGNDFIGSAHERDDDYGTTARAGYFSV